MTVTSTAHAISQDVIKYEHIGKGIFILMPSIENNPLKNLSTRKKAKTVICI